MASGSDVVRTCRHRHELQTSIYFMILTLSTVGEPFSISATFYDNKAAQGRLNSRLIAAATLTFNASTFLQKGYQIIGDVITNYMQIYIQKTQLRTNTEQLISMSPLLKSPHVRGFSLLLFNSLFFPLYIMSKTHPVCYVKQARVILDRRACRKTHDPEVR